MVSSSPTILWPGFKSQAHHLFVLLKLLFELEKNENKQKEAGIGPYLKKTSTTGLCSLFVAQIPVEDSHSNFERRPRGAATQNGSGLLPRRSAQA